MWRRPLSIQNKNKYLGPYGTSAMEIFFQKWLTAFLRVLNTPMLFFAGFIRSTALHYTVVFRGKKQFQ